MYEDDLPLGKLKENCLLLKLYRKLRKLFLSPRRESNPQPSDLRWDALIIELSGLRWQREGHDMYRFVSATHVLLNSSLDMSVYLINSAIWVLVAQLLERLTEDQKCSIPAWSSETFFWVCDKAWVTNSFPLIYQAASHPHTYIFVNKTYWHIETAV